MVALSAKVEKEGGLTVAARQLYEIVKGLPDDEVRVRRTEQNWAEIRAGKVEFKVVGHVGPRLPEAAQPSRRPRRPRSTRPVLRDMIAKTIFSVSLDETRQHLAGVLFESDGATARMVSTDGHRLSKVARPLPGGPKLATGVLIPRKGIVELRRAIETREAPCEIGIHEGNFVLKADDVGISVKLIDGQFPPYDQVIPKDNERAFVVSRLALLDALKRVALMSSDKTLGVRLALDKGKLRVESDNPDLGAAQRGDRRRRTRGRRCRSASTRATSSTCSRRSRRRRCASSCRGELDPARGAAGRRQRLRLRRHADAALI